VGVPGGRPLDGTWEPDGDDLVFAPRFPFVAGVVYEVAGVGAIELPCPTRARVDAIYPTADTVPLNLLRLYIAFTEVGGSAEDVSIRRVDTGRPLEGVFASTDPELWDRERRRLTLLLDPGRIKRGLAGQRDAGYPLQEGVSVIVSARGTERRYAVGPSLRERVDPTLWDVGWNAGRLKVEFDRPLDRALLEHTLTPVDERGDEVSGTATIAPGERSWRFETELRPHLLVVDTRLEDIAGNSVARVFDRDLEDPAHARLDASHVAIGIPSSRSSPSSRSWATRGLPPRCSSQSSS
jgi:hypothetical protein